MMLPCLPGNKIKMALFPCSFELISKFHGNLPVCFIVECLECKADKVLALAHLLGSMIIH